MTGDSGGT